MGSTPLKHLRNFYQVHLTSKKRTRNVFSLEMSKLFALLSTASRVQSRRTVLSMTHRLTLPYSLDDGAMSRLGEHVLADERMDDGGWFISPPLQSGGESDKSFAVKAPALSLAVRAP